MIDAIVKAAIEDAARKIILLISAGMLVGAAITYGTIWLMGVV